MQIGIIFAMEEELVELKKEIEITSEEKIYDLTFYKGTFESVECILVMSGVGKVNAARTAQILIDKMNVSFVFNIGVAGGIASDLQVGDIVIGEKLVQHDFDITAFNHEKGYIPNVGIFINSDCNLVKLAQDNISGAVSGIIASGDIFCTEYMMSEKINKKFNALCVEMEGASIAQVCYLSGVPFLVLRSISDVPNNDNVITYEEFLKSSSVVIAEAMKKIILNLN